MALGKGLRRFVLLLVCALVAVLVDDVIIDARVRSSTTARLGRKGKEKKLAHAHRFADEKSYWWGIRPNDDFTERTAVLYKTTIPIHPNNLESLRSMAERLYGEGRDASVAVASDLIVMIDTTNKKASEVRRARERLASVVVDGSNWTLPVYEFDLSSILSAYPELTYYLYESGSVRINTTGHCCGKPELWQIQVLPACLLQRDLSLIPDHEDDDDSGDRKKKRRRRRYRSYWIMQDDVEIYSVEGGFVNGSLARWFSDQEEKYPYDLLGYRFDGCPTAWHDHRHTPNFHKIVSKMNETNVRWHCVSEGMFRLSDRFLEAYGKLVRKNVYAFCETMHQPVAWATNHSYHVGIPRTTFEGLPPYHKYSKEQREEIFQSTLYNKSSIKEQQYNTYMLQMKK